MATWIAHIRVAEKILNNGHEFSEEPFIVGNIGPDSGVPNEDWSEFNPPKTITHWTKDKKDIEAEEFYKKYIEGRNFKGKREEYSFLMGYYIHLLTDIEWSTMHRSKRKKYPEYEEKLKTNPKFIWEVKKDWYGLDFLYLENNPKSVFFTTFQHIGKVPDYLDYFPSKAFERQVKYITEYYLGENDSTKRNFKYLTKEEMDKFIKETTNKLSEIIDSKG